jgi:hypothetical protein
MFWGEDFVSNAKLSARPPKKFNGEARVQHALCADKSDAENAAD